MSTIINVILSGGIGSRLWPLSRKSNPKQYLEIFNTKSLFELTIERNQFISDEILIVGNKSNFQKSTNVLQKLEIKANQIIESTPRNTAAAIAFAALSCNPEDILLISPSDHIIEGTKNYKSAIEKAIELAKQNHIVTFGIVPTKPETGYGYIEYFEQDVLSFREKPDLKTAAEFIKNKSFLWNSGMFCFKAEVFLEELKIYSPEILEAAKNVLATTDQEFLDEASSMKIPSISVDYAVMEKSKRMKVIAAEFQWSDLGSFDSVYDYLKKTGHPVDASGNMTIGTQVHTEFLGLQNTIFVQTKDANLILQKENAQEIKEIYSRLEAIDSDLIK